ncbi:Glucose-6-phosphate 1-dehydrogenase [Coemansia sp. RSA 990]|nr:Glucose-6-phosphate 1-dehydrogenase [Coemansia sp. RSA 990]
MLRISAQGARRLAVASSAARRFATNTIDPAAKPAVKPETKPDAKPETKPAAAEKSGVRPPGVTFSNEPKPAKKKKGHKIRNTLVLAVLASAGFVGAAVYAMEDREFRRQFEHYVPGARSFMQLIKHHNNSVMMALSDVGYSVYDQSVYTGRFIYQQFYSLINMLRHNSWHAPDDKVDPPKPAVPPAASDKRKDNGISIPAAPLDRVQVAVDIPPLESESEAVVALSKALTDVVSALNKRGLAPENVQQLKVLSDSLVALDKHLALLKDEERTAVEAALAEERGKFEAALTDVQEAAQLALKAREAELIEARDRLLRTAANAADERLAQELTAQRDLLERRYNRFVRARVDEERGRRLAQLDFVEAQLHELTQMAEQSGDLIKQSQAVSRLSVAISAFKNAIAAAGTQQPFASELSALISASASFPATNAAASSISHALAEQGVLSLVELEDRFETVRKEIRSVSLVPENGNFGSQVLSATLSKVMFEKDGLVEGNDVESILARSSHYLRRHDLDSATRELNQLKGWPKQLARDWISAARARLEVEQAIGVAEAEEQLAKITFL